MRNNPFSVITKYLDLAREENQGRKMESFDANLKDVWAALRAFAQSSDVHEGLCILYQIYLVSESFMGEIVNVTY